ncbi:hypothetical protein [Microbispora sp. CA-102843]|uniref:hypothetical protein n=1 Tax=Microbispora sp. CA-102843 TaxID=3239952 RepID=UPI003D922D15
MGTQGVDPGPVGNRPHCIATTSSSVPMVSAARPTPRAWSPGPATGGWCCTGAVFLGDRLTGAGAA